MSPLKAVHCMDSSRASWPKGRFEPGHRHSVFYSHRLRSLESLRAVAALARILMRPLTGRCSPTRLPTASRSEGTAFANRSRCVLVEAPVSDAFFKITGTRRPSVDRHVEPVARCAQRGAVRTTRGAARGEALRMSFNWLGSSTPSRTRA